MIFFNTLRADCSFHIVSLLHHIDENGLVAGLKAKDRTVLEYLYTHYSGALYGVIKRILIEEEIAEEVLQDVFLKIWDNIASYDPGKGRLFTWMLRLARNLAIDKTRSKEMSRARKTGDIHNIVHIIERQEFVEQETDSIGVHHILNGLPEEQKLVVDYLYFKGYSQKELAEEFNIPLGTVKTRLRLAMKQLRLILKVI